MSDEIPEDVMRAANGCLMLIDNQTVDAAGRRIHVSRSTIIARAIMAERKRCAAKAQAWAENLDLFKDKTAKQVMEGFAAAIRGDGQ